MAAGAGAPPPPHPPPQPVKREELAAQQAQRRNAGELAAATQRPDESLYAACRRALVGSVRPSPGDAADMPAAAAAVRHLPPPLAWDEADASASAGPDTPPRAPRDGEGAASVATAGTPERASDLLRGHVAHWRNVRAYFDGRARKRARRYRERLRVLLSPSPPATPDAKHGSSPCDV